MGDRTSFQGTIYRCNPARWEHLVAFIEGEVGIGDGGDTVTKLGKQFSAYDVNCGIVDEIYSRLQEIDPTAVWAIWEDPKYEWLGLTAAYAGDPEQGVYTQECDADGRPVINREQLEKTGILERRPWEDLLAAQGRLRELYGLPWYERIEEAEAELKAAADRHAIEVVEGEDLEGDVGWRAYCPARHGKLEESWYGPWRLGDACQDDPRVTIAGDNPMDVAHDLAERDGELHLRSVGIDVDTDQVPSTADLGVTDGSVHDTGAPGAPA